MARKQNPPEGLRDQLAIHALGLIIGSDPVAFVQRCTLSDMTRAESVRNVASLAYDVADAMLEARDA